MKQVRHLLGADITAHVVSALITGWLDYCNALLAGLTEVHNCTILLSDIRFFEF